MHACTQTHAVLAPARLVDASPGGDPSATNKTRVHTQTNTHSVCSTVLFCLKRIGVAAHLGAHGSHHMLQVVQPVDADGEADGSVDDVAAAKAERAADGIGASRRRSRLKARVRPHTLAFVKVRPRPLRVLTRAVGRQALRVLGAGSGGSEYSRRVGGSEYSRRVGIAEHSSRVGAQSTHAGLGAQSTHAGGLTDRCGSGNGSAQPTTAGACRPRPLYATSTRANPAAANQHASSPQTNTQQPRGLVALHRRTHRRSGSGTWSQWALAHGGRWTSPALRPTGS